MNRITRYTIGPLFVLTVLAAGCVPEGYNTSRTVDFSNFQEFEYAKSATVMCGDTPSYQAWIRRQDDGSYTVEFSAETREEYTELPETCPDYWEVYVQGRSSNIFETETIEVAPAIPPRQLTDDEAQRVLNVFSNIKINTVWPDYICASYCQISMAQWDQFKVFADETCLSEPTDELSSEALLEITNLLNELKQN